MTGSTAILDEGALAGVLNPVDGGGVCTSCDLWFEDPTDNMWYSSLELSCDGSTPLGEGTYNVVSNNMDPDSDVACQSDVVEVTVSLVDVANPIIDDSSTETPDCGDNLALSTSMEYDYLLGVLVPMGGTPGNCISRLNYEHPDFSDNCSMDTLYIKYTAGSPAPDALPTDVTITGDAAIAAESGAAETTDFYGSSTMSGAVTTVTYMLVDSAGNVTNCSFTVTVTDDEDPVATCVADAAVTTGDAGDDEAQDCGYTISDNSYDASATDNCDVVSLEHDYGPAPSSTTLEGAEFPIGTTTVTWTATDGEGNTDMCSHDITVTDGEDPELVCPPDITVETNMGVCTTTGIAGINMVYQGNDDPSELPLSINEWYDNCPNADISYTLTGATTGSGGPVTDGNIDAGTETYNLGTTTVTYEVTDANGNMASCSFTVTVVDNERPVINDCANLDITIGTDLGQCDAFYTWTPPQDLTDNCALASFTCEVTDSAGNVISTFNTTPAGCTNQVGFAGLWAPGFWTTSGNGTVDASGAPGSIMITDAPGSGATTYCITVPDDGFIAFNFTENSPTAEGGGGAGYSINGSFSVTSGLSGSVFVPVMAGDVFCYEVTSDGVADDKELTITNFQFNCAGSEKNATLPLGCNTIKYTLTDTEGNDTMCIDTVKVVDDEDPTALCEANPIVVQLNNMGNGSVTVGDVNAGSSDNCAIESLSVSPNTFDCDDIGNQMVTLTVTDVNGNTATCMATVSVEDNIPPTISCAGLGGTIGTSSGGGACEGKYSWTVPMPMDNCPDDLTISQTIGGGMSATVMAGSMQMSTFPEGTTTVSYTVEDGGGNIGTCSFNVIVEDDEAPTIQQLPNITMNVDPGLCSAVVTWMEPNVSDNCDPLVDITVTSNHVSGDVFPVGMTTVTYTAIDESGNVATMSFKITVVDNVAPTPQCQDITVNLSASAPGMVTVNAGQIDAGSQDDCGILNFMISKDGGMTFAPSVKFDCSEVGDNDVILKVTDAGGNMSQCNAVVTVQDVTPPLAVCQPFMAILSAGNPGTVTVVPNDIDGGSADNCSIVLKEIAKDENNDGIPDGPWSSDINYDCDDVGNRFALLRVTDPSGLRDTCTAIITVKDNTNPTIVCPPSVTISTSNNGTGDCEGEHSWIHPTPTDNCDISSYSVEYMGPQGTDGPFGVNGGTSENRAFYKGVTTVKYTVVDEHGNMTMCTFTVTVEDDEPPMIVCPDNVTIGTSTGGMICEGEYTWNHPDPTDNCPDITLDVTYDPPSGMDITNNDITPGSSNTRIFALGTTTITYKVTDAVGLMATCSFTVTVVDDEDPVFLYCPTDITVDNVGGDCNNLVQWTRPVRWAPSDIEDCNLVTVTETISDAGVQSSINNNAPYNNGFPSIPDGDVSPTATFPVGTTTITYKATDAAGNMEICEFTVTVLDTEAPSITCPMDQPLGTVCANGEVPDYSSEATITDNCSDYTVTQDPLAGTMLSDIPGISDPPVAGEMFDVTITVTDNNPNGLSSSCTFTVTLTDDEDPIPTIAGPTLPDAESECDSIDITAPTATDCGDLIYGVPSQGTRVNPGVDPPIYRFYVGTITITWTYVDADNNTSAQTQTIIVTPDNEPPTALCQDITVNLSSTLNGGMASITPAMIDDGSFDNCSGVTLDLDITNFDCDDKSPPTNEVTLTVTDAAGNSSTCTANVTVNDVTPPVFFNVPPDMTVECDNIPDPDHPTVDDNCDPDPDTMFAETYTQSPSPSNCNHYNYEIWRTWTATDECGNSSQVSKHIQVQDTEYPTFDPACELDITLYTSDGADCPEDAGTSLFVGQVLSPFDGWTVAGQFIGGLAGCLNDNCAPEAEIDIEVVSLTLTTGPPPFFDRIIDVAFELSDPCDNANPDLFECRYTIVDDVAPIIVCNSPLILPLPAPDYEITIDPNDNLVLLNNGTFGIGIFGFTSDDCGIDRVEMNPNTFDCDDVSPNPIPVTFTVYDIHGNSNVCFSSVIIQDTEDPVAVCQDITVSLGANGTVTFPASDLDGGSTDNCDDNLDFTVNGQSNVTLNCNHKGVNTLFMAATDDSGNFDICQATVTVVDNIPPTAVCQDITVNLDASGNVVITADEVDGGSFDNCTIVSRTIFPSAFNCSDVGDNTVVLTVEDCSGLIDTCHARVTVEDNVPPVASCTPADIFLDANGEAVVTPAHINNNSSDACGIFSMSVSPNVFNCDQLGPQSVTLTVTDVNGNVSTCTTTVTIIDNMDPTVTCMDHNAYLDANGEVIINTNDIEDGFDDNCEVVQLQLSQTHFDCSHVGDRPVVLTATDQSGNEGTCSAVVTVIDTVPATADCQDITVNLDPFTNMVSITPAQVDGGSFDACGILDMTVSPSTFGCPDVGNNVVTLTIEDVNGNFSDCEANVLVRDNTPPVAVCQDITVTLDETGNASIMASQLDGGSTDDCSDAVDLSFSASQTNFTCADEGDNTITLTVTDESGNTDQCFATVTVVAGTVKFTAGNPNGPAGSTINVPITVTNFLNIQSFQFSIDVTDPSVAVVTNVIENLGSGTYNVIINGNNISISWFTGTPLTLPNGATVAEIQVQLVGNPLESSPVVFGNDPTAIEASQDCGPDGLDDVPVMTMDGSANINDQVSVHTVSGVIMRNSDGALMENVTVELSGDVGPFTTMTNAAGFYSFSGIPGGSDIMITPIDQNNSYGSQRLFYLNQIDPNVVGGVSSIDLARIQKHIVSPPELTTPYELISAEASGDAFGMDCATFPYVASVDLSIIQSVIVGELNTYPNSPSWRYTPKSYVFPDPTCPWNPGYPQKININNIGADVTDADFWAMKVGDVIVPGAPLSITDGSGTVRDEEVLTLELDNLSLEAGERYDLTLNARDFKDMQSLQFTLEFDHNQLDLMEMKAAGIAASGQARISTKFAEQGMANISWFSANALSLQDETPVFVISFTAKTNIRDLEGLIKASSAYTFAEAVNKDLTPMTVRIEIEGDVEAIPEEFALLQNKPNPFDEETIIGFYLPQDDQVYFSVYDLAGKVIYTTEEGFEAGYNEIRIVSEDLPQTGMLYYEVQTSTHRAVKKMLRSE